MTKVKITVPYPILQILQGFCSTAIRSISDPRPTQSTNVQYFVLNEFFIANIHKIMPPGKRTVRFTLRQSQALSMFNLLRNLELEILEDMERNQILDTIARQMPQMLNQSPV